MPQDKCLQLPALSREMRLNKQIKAGRGTSGFVQCRILACLHVVAFFYFELQEHVSIDGA